MVRYFAIVCRPPVYGITVLAAITALGLVTTYLNPRDLDSSLGMILFVHMLLASSGFAPSARRGHFDPVLTRGHARDSALAAQWSASVLPGAAAWLVVSLAGLYLGSSAAMSALIGRRLAAFWIVSSVAWCAGFLLPRGAGGALWVGLLVVLLLWHADLLAAERPIGPLGVARGGATLVLCPFLLLGGRVPVGMPEIAGAATGAAVLLLATWRAGTRLDLFLAERS
jgi:hypothetical protein